MDTGCDDLANSTTATSEKIISSSSSSSSNNFIGKCVAKTTLVPLFNSKLQWF